MNERDWLTERFEENRRHLRGVAYRMLGSLAEAEDAVQETWLRLRRSDTRSVENLGGWLTTVVARVCLDMLRARKSRCEEAPSETAPEPVAAGTSADPEQEALLADSVGLALLVVLETLTPAERVAFVLHDLFAVPFEDIAPIVGRTPMSARQLTSRARRRVRGTGTSARRADRARQREVVDAFLSASREGRFEALLAMLDPEVVLRADRTAVAAAAARQAQGAPRLSSRVQGARAVADVFAGRAQGALPALVDGSAGAAWAPGGQPRAVFAFTIEGGRIVGIEMIADAEHIGRLDIELLDAAP
jgi:RNA polymerase sigma-70 factor (ECF subfamily)